MQPGMPGMGMRPPMGPPGMPQAPQQQQAAAAPGMAGPGMLAPGLRPPGPPMMQPGGMPGQPQQPGVPMQPGMQPPGAAMPGMQPPGPPGLGGLRPPGVPSLGVPQPGMGMPGAGYDAGVVSCCRCSCSSICAGLHGSSCPVRCGSWRERWPASPCTVWPKHLAKFGMHPFPVQQAALDKFETLSLGPSAPTMPGQPADGGVNPAAFPRPAGPGGEAQASGWAEDWQLAELQKWHRGAAVPMAETVNGSGCVPSHMVTCCCMSAPCRLLPQVGPPPAYSPYNCKPECVRMTSYAVPNSQASCTGGVLVGRGDRSACKSAASLTHLQSQACCSHS